METNTSDKLDRRLWLLLAALGAVLCVIGWYRYFT
jgi:hypothetical protein